MDIGGIYLTEKQMNDWKQAYPSEYQEYVDLGLLNEATGELFQVPEWMDDGDYGNGPFDFGYNASHEGTHW